MSTIDPLAVSLAAAVVRGTTGALSDGTRALLTKLVTLIRDKLRRRPLDRDTLEAATRHPHDTEAARQLADLIARHLREDPAFAQHARSLWNEISGATDGGTVTNIISGQVHGTAVQARDIHGEITFHPPPQ